MKKIWVDCETTGLEPGAHALIQLAGIIEIDGEVVEEFDYQLRPLKGQMINPKALAVSGVTLEEITAYRDSHVSYVEFLGLLEKYIDRFDKSDKFLWIGQNPRFDYGFVEALFNRHENPYLYSFISYHLIDIASIAMALKDAKRIELKSLKLESIAETFDVQFEPHNALEDARACRKIYLKMLSYFS
ncbi:3'-5' exonuclease [PVC group bacterium]|nr:3'-5' exonuclease [PVC group bacterium]